mgnify:FL=1|jgi:hypothetical protein
MSVGCEQCVVDAGLPCTKMSGAYQPKMSQFLIVNGAADPKMWGEKQHSSTSIKFVCEMGVSLLMNDVSFR